MVRKARSTVCPRSAKHAAANWHCCAKVISKKVVFRKVITLVVFISKSESESYVVCESQG